MALYSPGDMIADRYRVEREIGEGGFATVYDATEAQTGQRVAVKVLKPDDGHGYARSTRARFEREANAVARLRSPHTVELRDFGESRGKLFIVFEMVNGEPLRNVLDRRGRLSPDEAVDILVQLLNSLGEAHRAGVLHRDVKPENIHVIDTGRGFSVKLLDFGLARPTDDGSPGVTKTGELVGTPRYMAPEQLLAKPLSSATDIYSAGVVFLEMLVGAERLQGNEIGDQLARLRAGHVLGVPELHTLAPHLVRVVTAMTATSIDDRLTTTEAVLRALPGGPKDGTTRFERGPKPSGRWALVVVLVLLVAAAFWASRKPAVREHTPPARRSLPTALTEVPAPPVREPPADAGKPQPARLVLDRSDPRPSPGCKSDGEVPDHLRMLVPYDNDAREPSPLLVVLPRDVSSAAYDLQTLMMTREERGQHLLNLREEFVRSTKLLGLAHDLELLVFIPSPGRGWDGENDAEEVRMEFEELAAHACIDLRRVYLVGDYDGGYSVLRLSCDDWVTAVATYAHLAFRSRPDELCDGAKPALLITPTESPRVPLQGNTPCSDYGQPPLVEYEAAWRKRNGCEAETSTKTEVEDGSCTQWACDAPLRSCYAAGGYNWPGAVRRVRRGMTNACGNEPGHRFPIEAQLADFITSVPPLPSTAE